MDLIYDRIQLSKETYTKARKEFIFAMSDKNIIPDPEYGCFFADPKTLPGDYEPAKEIMWNEAKEYARRIKEEEGRDVTFEEMQRFVKR